MSVLSSTGGPVGVAESVQGALQIVNMTNRSHSIGGMTTFGIERKLIWRTWLIYFVEVQRCSS
jgi:hypothetical protein